MRKDQPIKDAVKNKVPPFKLKIPPHRPDDSTARDVEGAEGERDKFDIVPSKSPTARRESEADKTQR